MSRPIVEPSTPGRVTGLGYDTRQLQRRPSPVAATPGESGLTRGSPILTELVTVNNALPQSDGIWTKYPFDLTFGGTIPVGADVGNGTPLPPDQYFVFDAENACVGLPFGGTIMYEASFAGANFPDPGTTWDMAIQGVAGNDCTNYDPESPPTFSSIFGTAPENVSIYDGVAMTSTFSANKRDLLSTNLVDGRQWLEFYYMHNGPTVEDVNFSRILLRISYWPAGYVWNTEVIQEITNGKGILVVSPAIPDEITAGDMVTVTFAGEENPTDTDWIAMFALGGDTGDFEGNWVYTNSGTQTAGGTPAASGTWTIDTTGLSSGDYQFRWMYNDTLAVLTEGNSIVRIS